MEAKRQELTQKILERLEDLFRCIHQNIRSKNSISHIDGEQISPFEEYNLSGRQILFLFMVNRSKEGLSVKDLASFSRVTPGAVTQFIDVLIQKNLLKREEDPNDRRGVKIKLTDHALSRFSEFKKQYFSSINPAFKNLTTEELNTLINLLEKVEPLEALACPSWSK